MSEAQQLADEYWTYLMSTNLGFAMMRGDLTHLDRWQDMSSEGVLESTIRYEDFANRARSTEAADLGERALLETVAASAVSNTLGNAQQLETMAPNLQTGLLTWLLPGLTIQPLVTADHGERYLDKLRNFGSYVDQICERLTAAAGSDRVPLASHAAATADKVDDLLARRPSPFAAQQPPIDLTAEEAETWTRSVAGAVEAQLVPGLRQFRDVLRETVVPTGRPDEKAGLIHLDGGIELYRRLVKAHTTLDVTPQQVHDTGLAQIERLGVEYRTLAGPLLGTDDLGEIFRRLRDDPALHFSDVDPIVDAATNAFRKARAAMGDWFGRLPEADCEVRATDIGPLAYYRPPAEDGSQPGRFFFNTSKPEMWATFQVAAIAYHEGIPGHHLQLALGIENRDIHDLHRLLYLAGFGEGWGLYTERLSDEMGLYADDWERVGMLFADSLRACRLVVDTGMHALGWSRRQAIDYMVDNSPMAVHECEEEIDRYIGTPGQATAYMMGRLEIDRIRAEAEQRLGDGFDIAAFHDAVLSNGTIPLSMLEPIVRGRLG